MASISKTHAADENDALLKVRFQDAVRLCLTHHYPHFLGFLDERQQALLQPFFHHNRDMVFTFYGGYPDAERAVLGMFPSYMEPDEQHFPLESIGFSFRKGVSLSHRDFLGTMLSCGIKRDKIGDILCGDGVAVAFVNEDIAPFLEEQISKVGGEGVTVTRPYQGNLPDMHTFQEIRDTIASARLDATVKVAAGISREAAVRLIASGAVALNHIPCQDTSSSIKEGDLLSIRGQGRFRVAVLGPQTRKGRLFLTIQKYV